MSLSFTELRSTALIAAEGPDAGSFLHAQLTSDVAGLAISRTQYSGYCSPKGRLLATLLIWRTNDRFFLQLPATLRESIQTRLSKYVLRAKVRLVDVTPDYRLFGVSGPDAAGALEPLFGRMPVEMHEVVSSGELSITRLPVGRYLVAAAGAQAVAVQGALSATGQAEPESAWTRLDIEAGIPVVTPKSQEQYVPQMMNLDLIGAVSYTKGCYPGQEIVARTYYLGRLKQRLYRIHVEGAAAPQAGEPLYTAAFGPEQASGAIVNAAPAAAGGHDALAVIQTSSVLSGGVHWKSLDGPVIGLKPLPYAIPE